MLLRSDFKNRSVCRGTVHLITRGTGFVQRAELSPAPKIWEISGKSTANLRYFQNISKTPKIASEYYQSKKKKTAKNLIKKHIYSSSKLQQLTTSSQI